MCSIKWILVLGSLIILSLASDARSSVVSTSLDDDNDDDDDDDDGYTDDDHGYHKRVYHVLIPRLDYRPSYYKHHHHYHHHHNAFWRLGPPHPLVSKTLPLVDHGYHLNFQNIHGIHDIPFGMPRPNAHSNLAFDKVTTREEIYSKHRNPLPFYLNPAIQAGIAGLSNLEQAHLKNSNGFHGLLKPLINILGNPVGR